MTVMTTSSPSPMPRCCPRQCAHRLSISEALRPKTICGAPAPVAPMKCAMVSRASSMAWVAATESW